MAQSEKIGSYSPAELWSRLHQLEQTAANAPPEQIPELQKRAQALCRTIGEEKALDQRLTTEADAGLTKARAASDAAFNTLLDHAKKTRAETYGLLRFLVPIDIEPLRRRADRDAGVAPAESSLAAHASEASEDSLLLAAANALRGALHPFLVEAARHGVVERARGLRRYSSSVSDVGGAVGAAIESEAGLNQVLAVRNQLQRYSSSESNAGANIATAILFASGRFDPGRDTARAHELAERLQRYSSSESNAGANIAAAILFAGGVHSDAEVRSVLAVRDQLQRYSSSESNAGANIAAAILCASERFDPDRDTARVRELAERLQRYSSCESNFGANVAAATLFASGVHSDAEVKSVLAVRDQLQRYSSSESNAGANIAAAMLVASLGFVAEEHLPEVLATRDQLQRYSSSESNTGANIGAAVLHGGSLPLLGRSQLTTVDESDLEAVLTVRNELQSYSSSESNFGANIAAALMFRMFSLTHDG